MPDDMPPDAAEHRDRRLDAILGAYLEAAASGCAPDRQELLDQHPELAEALRAFFADYDRVHRLAQPLQAVAQAARGDTATEPAARAAAGSEATVELGRPDAEQTTDLTTDPPLENGDGNGGGDLPRGARVRYFGDYELSRVLGRGGMGVVYKARQVSLNRPVALKMIRAGLWAGEEEVRRFKNEAEAIANLDHPQIVTIHEISEHQGQHYFSMKLVEGPSLTERLEAYAAKPREAAKLVSEVARAVHHAHQRGILHRDLKPSNILLDREGRPHVTDFGLAKKLEGNGALSISGAIVGTPQYMSPEQASGSRQAITTATDIYGLGALLYAALTARPPFQADSVVETLRQVQEKAVEPPSQVNRKIDRDLETICLKCLEKDAKRRYDSAAALADDLERYLRGEQILARRTGPIERSIKWAKRRPVIAALLAVVALTTALGVVGVFWQWQRAEDQRDQAFIARNDAIEARTVAVTQRTEAQQRSARLALDRGIALCQQGEVGQGMLWLARTLELAPPEETDLARVARTNLASWRNRLAPLQGLLHHGSNVAALSSDGTRLLTGHESADGKSGTARLWDVASREPIGPPLEHQAPVRRVDFSPDGAAFLTIAGEQLRLWDAATRTAKGAVIPIPRSDSVSFSPDGKTICCNDPTDPKTSRLFDAATGQPFGQPLTSKEMATRSLYSPDGSVILKASHQTGSAQLWNARTGEPKGQPLWPEGFALTLGAFSPDGGSLLVSGNEVVGRVAQGPVRLQVWDPTQGKVIGPATQPHAGMGIPTLKWSRDSKRVLTSCWDRTARLWDAATGKLHIPPLFHPAPVLIAAFSPDERVIVTSGLDSAARLWDAATGEPLSPFLRHSDRVRYVWFGPNGKTLLTSSLRGTLRSWEVPMHQPVGASLPHIDPVFRLDVADRDVVMTQVWAGSVGTSAEVRLWNAVDRRPLGPPLQRATALTAWLSPDGRRVLSGRIETDEAVQIWDVATGRLLCEPIPIEGTLQGACFHPRGEAFVTCVESTAPSGPICDGRLWDAATGRSLGKLFTIPSRRWSVNVAFRPDGAAILVQEAPELARLWDCATHQPLGSAIEQTDVIRSFAFHPDGKTVITGGHDGIARFWDVASGRLLDQLPLEAIGWTEAVGFSPDGRTVLTGTYDRPNWGVTRTESDPLPSGSTRLWDNVTRLPLGAPFDLGGSLSAAFSRDGTMLLIGCRDGQVRFWPVPKPIEGDVARIALWTQVVTGLELDTQGKVHVLDAETWQVRHRRLDELGGPPRT